MCEITSQIAKVKASNKQNTHFIKNQLMHLFQNTLSLSH
jgi:hypothetical protein